jgi:hypothetical protein
LLNASGISVTWNKHGEKRELYGSHLCVPGVGKYTADGPAARAQGRRGKREAEVKRDTNLVRSILIDIESSAPGKPIFGFQYEGREVGEILEHIQLLIDADFIEGEVTLGNTGEPVGCVVMRMTWEGQEFLAKAKNDTIWKKVMAEAEKKGMSTSLTIVNGLLEKAAKKYVGLDE